MKSAIAILLLAVSALATSACFNSSGRDVDYQLVYSSGFSFKKYDYMIFGKSNNEGSNPSSYGMDIEVANMLSRYNVRILGDSESGKLDPEQKSQTLFVRFTIITSGKEDNLLTMSFDDMVTGKAVASISVRAQGDMFDPNARTRAVESLGKPIVQALERDKGIKIMGAKVRVDGQ